MKQDSNNILVSIVIPVYNSKNYLKRIIDCVEFQTYRNWELVVVDDHSSDGVYNVMKRISNEKIHYVLNKGKGVSAARNTGIDFSHGKYLAFVDADDMIDKEYLARLIYSAETYKTDIVLCDYYEILHDNKKKLTILPWRGLVDSMQVLPQLIYPKKNEKLVWLPVWRTLISKRKLKKTRFDAEIEHAEDLLFMIELLLNSKKVYCLNEARYYYNRTANSSMNKYIKDNLNQQEYFHKSFITLLKKNNVYTRLKLRYLSNRASMYSFAISNAVKCGSFAKSMIEISEIRNTLKRDKMLKINMNNLYISIKIKLALLLLRLNFKYLLYVIYSKKEKRRLNTLSKN